MADVLDVIGRLEREVVSEEGIKLMSKALESQRLDIRDAAVLALEHWGGRDSIKILRKHAKSEQVDWLRDYAILVAESLEHE